MKDNPYHNPMSEPERRANYEYQLAVDCILPFLKGWGIEGINSRVLDIGCGTGGLAVALADRGARCVGIDHNSQRILQAQKMADQHQVDIRFLEADIFNLGDCQEKFDLIILSEVLEHLVFQSKVEALLKWCRKRLVLNGRIYASFPPWYSPFAGHQAGWPRMCYIPWYHLLSDKIKRWLVPKQVDQYFTYAQELNHLTIKSFEQIVGCSGLKIVHRKLYFIRPEYYWRYKVPPLRAFPLVSAIPFIREYLTTGAYYLLGIPDKEDPSRLTNSADCLAIRAKNFVK